jgi:predicted Zn-dependent protease
VAARLNKKKAAALVEQAMLLHAERQYARVEALLEPVIAAGVLPGSEHLALYAECLDGQGKRDEARSFLEAQLEKRPHEPMLAVRLGVLLLQQNRPSEAVEVMSRARQQLRREPMFLTHFALALLRVGRLDEADKAVAAALLTGGGDDTRLALALLKAQRGDAAGAETVAVQVGTRTADAAVRASARAIEADCRLMQGDARGALDRFSALEKDGALEPDFLPHAALAAQLAGDDALATAFMERRRPTAAAEDHLLFARVFLSRGRPTDAMVELTRSEKALGEKLPGFEYEFLVTKGRALRLLGRQGEARACLDAARERPEAELNLLGARLWLELGHLAAEGGDFDTADAAFTRALALDPNEAEASRAKELSSRRTAWKQELAASAQARIDAARADAEAMKRRFLAREGEIEAMRRELERMKQMSVSAQAQAQQATQEAAAAKAEAARRVREELEARERDVEAKAQENLEAALGAVLPKCPEALVKMVLVAERTYQKGFYSELPAAAVAVLFSGALERALFMLIVQRFDAWLDDGDRRAPFLAGAVRERRGKRVEYFDRFVEAFDRQLDSRAPSLGEVSRALSRRHDAPLAGFHQFLQAQGISEAFLDALARFVQDAKERLRDPVAHGLAIDLTWDELKAFREAFLFRFEGGPGLLAQLLGAP